MKLSKIHNDFKIYYAYVCLSLAAGIFLLIINSTIFYSITLKQISFFIRTLWSGVFILSGFSLLVIKICINSIYNMEPVIKKSDNDSEEHNRKREEEKGELDKIKEKWRYISYYPLMLIALALSSTIISTYQFKSDKILYLGMSALISFFLGYFIDSLPGIINKLGGN